MATRRIGAGKARRGAILDGKTAALIEAVRGRQTDVIKKLLKAGVDVNAANAHGVRPVHVALDTASMQLLLDAGADLTATLPPRNCFCSASVIELLIQAGADVNSRGITGRTMLMDCCINDYTMEERRRLVTLLLGAGASVEARDNEGAAVLHHAARTRDPDFLRFLVDRGAPLEVRDNRGATVWDHVRNFFRWQTKDYQPIKEKGVALGLYDPRVDELIVRASQDNLAKVVKLIAGGVDINARGDFVSPANPKCMITGVPALDAAATCDRAKTFKSLLGKGADPNVATTRPLSMLCSLLEAMTVDGRPQFVEILVGAGADIGRVDLFNVFSYRPGGGRWTDRHNQCVEILVDAGIDLNASRCLDEGGDEETLVDVAKYKRNKKLIEILTQVKSRSVRHSSRCPECGG